MPFTLDRFSKLRPCLFHLTATVNVSRIVRDGLLCPASATLKDGGRTELLRERRAEGVEICVGTETVHLRDQRPLHGGNMALQGGWSLEDVIQELNHRVFFWPGTLRASNSMARRLRIAERAWRHAWPRHSFLMNCGR